jgi:hypothetical protein
LTDEALPRSVDKTAVATPYQLVMIDLKVRHLLGRLVPIWLNLDTIAHRHIAPVHSGGPRAGVMRGDSGSTPLWSSIWRMSAL